MANNSVASTSMPHATLERADSDGSDSSAISSNTSNSACSSLFSINNANGDNAERRSSFASSVQDEELKESLDEDDGLLDSSDLTPTPSLPLPSPSMHIAASSASSDGGSDSSVSMATPTAELYGLSLQPVSLPFPRTASSPSPSPPDSSSSSPPSSATMPTAATRSPHQPASTNKTVIDTQSQHKGERVPLGTPPEMFKFAQRVASRGVSLSHQANAGSVQLRNISSESRRSTSSRPSTSHGRVMNAEGFPWTARPSSYTPRSSHASSSSRPASSSSSASYTQTSNRLIATPSDIFSAFQDNQEEEDSDALSSLFPSTSSASRSSSYSTSRSATNQSATTTESTALHHQQQTHHAKDTAQPSFLKDSQSYASSSSTETIRQRSSNVNTAFEKQRQSGNVNEFGDTRVTTAYPASNLPISALSMMASSESRNMERLLSEQRQEQDQIAAGSRNGEGRGDKRHISESTPVGKLGIVRDQHSLTPDSRSDRGGQESPSTSYPSSSSEMQSAEASAALYQSLQSVPPASSPSSFSHHQTQQSDSGDSFIPHDPDTSRKRGHRSSASSASPSSLSSASVFRYEAPMAAALILLPPAHQAHHAGGIKATSTGLSNRLGSQYTIPPSALPSSSIASMKTGMSVSKEDASSDAIIRSAPDDQKHTPSTRTHSHIPSKLDALDVKIPSPTLSSVDSNVRTNPITSQSLPSSKHVSLEYGNDLKAGERRSSTPHLNSLNYHAGVGDNTYSSPSSVNITSGTGIGHAAINILSRPATSKSYSSIYGTSSSSRPWVKDSDNSSIRSSSGVSSDGSSCEGGNDIQMEASVMSPAAPPPVPFLSTAPAPPGCRIQVEALQPDGFDVYVTLPGFTYENITLALKRNGALHILADKYDGSAGHFERMVELGEAAMNCKVTAEFNGHRLKVLMRKKAGYSTRTSASSASSISSNITTSSTGSSVLNYTSISNGGKNRNSDQLNYDPTLAMMMPPASRNSSSSSSPIVTHAPYSPQLYFGGIDTAAVSNPSSPIMYGSSAMTKSSTHTTDGRKSNTSPLFRHASSFEADGPTSRRTSDPSIRPRNWADIPE